VLTAGVDLSAEETNTCLARIEWRLGEATVVDLRQQVSNALIVDATQEVFKIGIDCPFGWPVAFVDFVNAHQRGDVSAPPGLPIDWRRRLANRMTDLAVRRETGLVPLSVAADRIAHAAMRCAALLAEIHAAGTVVDRTGQTGKLVEVYPAASLMRWKLTHRGYKRRANSGALSTLVDSVLTSAPWLHLVGYEELCRSSDDAFDAVVAALSARASACGQTLKPSPDEAEHAAREGWIAIPLRDSLRRLPGTS
jgi:hypothetical protein